MLQTENHLRQLTGTIPVIYSTMIISSANNAFLIRGRKIMMNFKDDSARETDVSS